MVPHTKTKFMKYRISKYRNIKILSGFQMTIVTKVITRTTHNRRRQSSEPNRTQSKLSACNQRGKIRASRSRLFFFCPITSRSNAQPKQSRNYLFRHSSENRFKTCMYFKSIHLHSFKRRLISQLSQLSFPLNTFQQNNVGSQLIGNLSTEIICNIVVAVQNTQIFLNRATRCLTNEFFYST